MSGIAAGVDDTPEWQKSLKAGLGTAGAVAPFVGGNPLLMGGAALAGGLMREPAAEAPPAALVTGPSGAPPPPPLPQPEQLAQQVVAGQGSPGADTGALGAQARKLGAIGVGAAGDAARAKEGLGAAAGARKEATQEGVAVQQQKAEAQAGGLDQQLNEVLSYRQRLDQVRQGEDKAVEQAKQAHLDAVEDAKYAGVPSGRRKELQDVMGSSNATPQQKAQAKAELEKAQNIDPDQFLGGAGRKITAAIAMAMGAFGSALAGGPNHAMQIIQQSIQNNIEGQKSNFAKREREAGAAEKRIGMARDEGAAQEKNLTTDYAIGLEMAKKKVERQLAGLEGSEAAAKGKELLAMIDEEQAKTGLAIDQQARSTYLQASTAQGGLMADRAQIEERRAEADAKKKSGKDEAAAQAANLAARGFVGKPGLALSTEELKKVSDISGASGELLDAVGRLKELRQQALDNPAKLVDPGFRAASQTAFKQAQVAYKSGAALGTWDKGSAELLDDLFGKAPSGIGMLKARYDEIERAARASRDRRLDAFGVVRAENMQQGVPGERELQ